MTMAMNAYNTIKQQWHKEIYRCVHTKKSDIDMRKTDWMKKTLPF